MGRKILLADDSVSVRRTAELTFAEHDFEVIAVGNGALALAKAREEVPDIAILDVAMPEKTGYEVCREMKNDPRLKHIPVLLIINPNFEVYDEAKAREVGADSHLMKPFESGRLIKVVEDILARAKPPAAQAVPGVPPAFGTQVMDAPALDPSPWHAPTHPMAVLGGPESDDVFGEPMATPLALSTPRSAPAPTPSLNRTAPLERPAAMAVEATPHAPQARPVVVAPAPIAPAWPISPAESLGPFAAVEANAPAEDVLGATIAMSSGPLIMAETPLSAMPGPVAPVVEVRAPVQPVAQTAMASAATAPPPAEVGLGDFPEEILNAIVERAVARLSKDVVEQVVWQVVPDLAEKLIRKKLEELQ